MPPESGGIFEAQQIDQRLLNWGARRAAFRPYFLRAPRGRWPRGGPTLFYLHGRNGSARHQGFGPRPKTLVRRTAPSRLRRERSARQKAAHSGGLLKKSADKSAFAELGSAAGGLEAVLREFLSQFSLIFRAFPALLFSVILFGNHKNQRVFIEPEPDGKHRLPPQTAPLVYCTSPLRRCP